MLVPLGEILGVSVTELLLCERRENGSSIDNDVLVKNAFSYAENNIERAYVAKSWWKSVFPAAAAVGGTGLVVGMKTGASANTVYTLFLLSFIFGLYFVFFVQTRLPSYYDDNRISGVFDSPFRMNIPGLSFNNSNWPYVIKCGRIWTYASVSIFPSGFASLNPPPLTQGRLYTAAAELLIGVAFWEPRA